MAGPTREGSESTGRDLRRDTMIAIGWTALALVVVTGTVLAALALLSDEQRDPLYRQAQAQGRSIGPTDGRLDDGSKVGAATFFEEDGRKGRICTVYGPPGERDDDMYCVSDTTEEFDALQWQVEPEKNIDLAVFIVDGDRSDIEFEFDGPTPGHASGWFQIPKPAVVVVYVGPPWDGLDVDTGGAG